MAKQAQTLTRYLIQNETKRNISTSPHSKQNKRFLATTTALDTNETSKYTYELLLTSAVKDCFSQRVYLYTVFCWRLNTLSLFFPQQMAKQAQTLTRYPIQNETKRDISTSPHSKQNNICTLVIHAYHNTFSHSIEIIHGEAIQTLVL